MSSGAVNATELTAALINQKDTLVEGIRYAQEVIDGSATILILTEEGIIALLIIYDHAPPAGAQVGVVVHAEKEVENAVVL